MTDTQQDFIRGNVAMLIHAFIVQQIPARTDEERKAKEQADNDTMAALQGLGSSALIDLNRCADALERLAAAQEGRLEVERTKAGLMKSALNPEPEKPGIIRANFAPPPPPPRG